MKNVVQILVLEAAWIAGDKCAYLLWLTYKQLYLISLCYIFRHLTRNERSHTVTTIQAQSLRTYYGLLLFTYHWSSLDRDNCSCARLSLQIDKVSEQYDVYRNLYSVQLSELMMNWNGKCIRMNEFWWNSRFISSLKRLNSPLSQVSIEERHFHRN